MSEKKYNYGIAILRMLMCFEVVLVHFWPGSASSILLAPFAWMKSLSVPVFMFLAFYFSMSIVFSTDSSKKGRRMRRLIYPQIAWAVIYWLPVLFLLREVGFSDLLWQVLTGHSPKLNPTMWFQSVLIVLTCIWFLIFRYLSEKQGLILLCLVTLLSIWFQYSGYNYKAFSPLRFELSYPLGRFFEMIQYATLGFCVAYFDVFEQLKKNRILFIVLFGVASITFVVLGHYIPGAPGFGYSNSVYLPAVFFMAGFAYLLPFERVPLRIREILQFVTKNTLGIYCMHRLVGIPLTMVLEKTGFVLNGFLLSIIIYIIAFGISFLMAKLSPRYLKPLVE